MKVLLVAGFVMVTGSLWAESISYVTVDTSTTPEMSNIYDSVTGLSQHVGTCYAVGTTNVVPCGTLSSTPATNTTGLTAASVAISNVVGYSPDNGVTGFADASAYADLASGTVDAFAAGLPCAPATDLCSDAGTAFGEMQDSLTFTNTTGSIQDITLSWTFDGSITNNATAPAGPNYTIYSLFCFAQGVSCFGNANSLPHGPISTSLFEMEDADGTVTTTAPTTGWASTSITGDPTDGLFDGVFAVPTGTSSESLNAYLFVSCGMATCDFSHTGDLSIGPLPDGVTYTSGSGVLLTSATPEPRSWLLMLSTVVFLLVGLRCRRNIVRC
jgi:hypothetical protein